MNLDLNVNLNATLAVDDCARFASRMVANAAATMSALTVEVQVQVNVNAI